MSEQEKQWRMTEQGRPATSGTGPVRYTLHIPLFIFPLGEFKELDELPLNYRLPLSLATKGATVERYEGFYVLRVEGFATPEEAHTFLQDASVNLLRLGVEEGMAINFCAVEEPLQVELNRTMRESFAEQNRPDWKAQDGTYTDGGILSNFTTIVPEHKRIWENRLPMGHEIRLLDARVLGEALAHQQSSVQPEKILNDKKLLLAIRLFGAAHSVYNLRVRFVLLVTVLEILGNYGRRQEFSHETIKVLMKRLKEARPNNAAEKLELDKLTSEVGKLRKVSIADALRELVFRSCGATQSEFEDQAKSDEIVKELYSIRSDIVHEGNVKPRHGMTSATRLIEGFEQLRKVASGVLKYRMDHPEPDSERVD